VLLSGCGGEEPHLSRTDAAPLIALARRMPGEAACAQARDIRSLQRRAVALVNARRVPLRLQDPLMSGVNALAELAPVCLDPVQAAAPSPAPRGRAPQRGSHDGGPQHDDKGHSHANRHGHGKRS
jgi:hypothetical protein